MRDYTKGVFIGGVFVATAAWAALALVYLVDGWWTWALATLAWLYAGSTTAFVLRNGVRTPPRKTTMMPRMTMTSSQNKPTGAERTS